jgi:PAS domain S-box-containing protein
MPLTKKHKIVANILKTPFLRSIFLACLAIAILVPIFSLFVGYPSFIDLLIKNIEEDAKRTATGFTPIIMSEKDELARDTLSDDLVDEIERLEIDYQLERFKLFSHSGKTLYSSNSEDIGKTNDQVYFQKIVARGNVHTNLVKKDTRSLEGHIVSADVVETCVPLMSDDRFLGAFEIYYDITSRKAQLDQLLARSIVILFAIALALLIGLVLILFEASQSIIKRQEAEEALRKSHDDLEIRVEARTADLKIANEKLKMEIEERKKSERALRDSEEKYRLLVENANDAIFVLQDEKIRFGNPRAKDIGVYLKVKLDEVSFTNYVHPEDRDMVVDRHRKRLNGENVPDVYSFRLISNEGKEMWVELNSVLMNWEGRPATLNFLRDITPVKKLETQLQQVRRMEALGTLAGGIAHDFNNLLMGIQGRTSLMMMDTDSSTPYCEELRGIEELVKSGADLTKQLLGFARGGKYDVKPTELNKLVAKTANMFGRTHKEIKLHTACENDLWVTEVDQVQMEQVLLNLYVNAWHAMPRGGDLFLQTRNVTLDESRARPFGQNPGRFVKVSIIDTGLGMDEATRQRIFEPFFTTKQMGRGTGLGLASVYGIIKNHGGIIDVFSEKGQGTNFSIFLPASEKEVAKAKELPFKVLRGTETILLVDDEDRIVDAVEKTLRKLGYSVLSARNGIEAIELYEKEKDNIDVVVLDMIMPVMGGGETYDRLKVINPDVKVILSSGYSIEGQASEILKRGCNAFIQKPFRVRQLSQKIRQVLENKTSS